MNSKFDMSAGIVKLDLVALKGVLGAACANSRDALERDIHEIHERFSDAYRAESNGNTDNMDYHNLCNANTHRTYMVRNALDYANAIEAYFHVSEAIKRDEVIIIKS